MAANAHSVKISERRCGREAGVLYAQHASGLVLVHIAGGCTVYRATMIIIARCVVERGSECQQAAITTIGPAVVTAIGLYGIIIASIVRA